MDLNLFSSDGRRRSGFYDGNVKRHAAGEKQ
jgi:hypothetical protein